jgi:hypothetical protein
MDDRQLSSITNLKNKTWKIEQGEKMRKMISSVGV